MQTNNLEFLIKLVNSIKPEKDEHTGKDLPFWTWHNGKYFGSHKTRFASHLSDYLKSFDSKFDSNSFFKKVGMGVWLGRYYDIAYSKHMRNEIKKLQEEKLNADI